MREHLVARVAGMRYNHPRQHALVVEMVARSFALAFNRVQLGKQIKKERTCRAYANDTPRAGPRGDTGQEKTPHVFATRDGDGAAAVRFTPSAQRRCDCPLILTAALNIDPAAAQSVGLLYPTCHAQKANAR